MSITNMKISSLKWFFLHNLRAGHKPHLDSYIHNLLISCNLLELKMNKHTRKWNRNCKNISFANFGRFFCTWLINETQHINFAVRQKSTDWHTFCCCCCCCWKYTECLINCLIKHCNWWKSFDLLLQKNHYFH